MAAFISSHRTEHGVPHAVTCRALGLSESWFYKWRDRKPTPREQRRAELAVKIREIFDASPVAPTARRGSPSSCGRPGGRSGRTPSRG